MTSHAIAYFSVIGIHNHQFHYEYLPSATVNTLVAPSEIWLDAITDITVIFFDKEESVPTSSTDDDENGNNNQSIHIVMYGKEWELIRYTVDGFCANCNQGENSRGIAYLGIQRRRVSGRLDHICEIEILHKNDPVPEGYEVIEKMMTAEKFVESNPNSSSRLIVKRASINPEVYFHGFPIIDDICLVNLSKDETHPTDFRITNKSINPKGTLCDKIIISYHQRDPLGLCDLHFESKTIERYPEKVLNIFHSYSNSLSYPQNHSDIELPVNDLPTFIFPQSLHLYCDHITQNFPLPDFSPLVFTDIKGNYLYTVCLRFFEPVPSHVIANIFLELYGKDFNDCFPSPPQLFCPKVLCVSSQYPFYRAMRVYLKQLYSLSLSPLHIPLESFISCLVSHIPAPFPGGRPYHVILDLDLIPPSSQPMSPIIFDLPSHYSLPFNETQFISILKYFTIDHILLIFYLLLNESKLIFISHSSTLLGEIMESFRLLLFPLKWTSTYITKLPEKLKGVLHAPGGYLIGLQNLHSTRQLIESNLPKFLRKFHLPDHCYVIDILHNKIFISLHDKLDPLIGTKVTNILKSFPSNLFKNLTQKLQNLVEIYQKQISLQYQMNIDSVFEMKLSETEDILYGNDYDDGQSDKSSDIVSSNVCMIDKLIRDGFLCFMCDLLGDFTLYFRSESNSNVENDMSHYNPTLAELLNIEEYLNDCDRSQRHLVTLVVETQMFAYFIQQWKEEPSPHLIFFYDCMKYQKILGFSTIPTDKRVPLKSSYPEILLDSITSAGHLDESVPLCDYTDAIHDLLTIFSITRKQLTLTHFLQKRKYFENKNKKEIHLNLILENIVHEELTYLNIVDRSLGPLILSGPCADPLLVTSDSIDMIPSERISFVSHHQIWPNLDSLKYLIHETNSRSQLGLKRLLLITAKTRAQSLNGNISLFLHDPSILLNCLHSHSFIKAIPKTMNVESQAATSLVLEIFSLSIHFMCCRVLQGIQPISAMLQNFSLLKHLEKLKLLNLLDPILWRSLFVACDSISSQTFSHTALTILYELMLSLEGVTPDLYIHEIYNRSWRKQTSKKQPIQQRSHENFQKYLDLGYPHENIGLIWYSNKLSDHKRRSLTLLTSPNKPYRSRSNSVPNSMMGSPSPPSPMPSPTIWQRFKSRKSITIEDPSDRIILSDETIHNMLSLKTTGAQSSFSLKSVSNNLNLILLSTEIQNQENFKNLNEININETNMEEKIQMWKRVTRPVLKKESFSISILAIQAEKTLQRGKDLITINNIYSYAWAGSDQLGKQKSSPGINLVETKDLDATDQFPTESFEFHLNSNYPPLYYHLEIYGDLVPTLVEDNQSTLFDQLLMSLVLLPENIPRDGSRVWVTINNISNSIFNSTSIDILLQGNYTLFHEEEKNSTLVSSPEQRRESDRVSFSSAESPSQTRLSWSQRFSSVFTRKSLPRESIETTRSITPPPPPPAPAASSSSLSLSSPLEQLQSSNEFSLQNMNDNNQFSDSEEDDSSTTRSESTTATRRSFCSNDPYPVELLKVDIPNHSDEAVFNDLTENSLQGVNQLDTSEEIRHKEEDLPSPIAPLSASPSASASASASLSNLKQNENHEITQTSLQLLHLVTEQDQMRRLGIFCCTPCSHCQECYLDEEILAQWCGLMTERFDSSVTNGNDLIQIHRIPCFSCKQMITPMLHIRQYEVRLENSPPHLHTISHSDVPYLSPLAVRTRVEFLVREYGSVVADANWLFQIDPVIYWNHIWYTCRLNLPTGLFQNTTDAMLQPSVNHPPCVGEIAIAWRESTVQAIILNTSLNKPTPLSIKDLFPSITEDHIIILENHMSHLDNSIPTISSLLKDIATPPSSSSPSLSPSPSPPSSILQSLPGKRARQLYLAYLFLLFLYHPELLSNVQDIPSGLSKGSSYDKAFIESISLGFSANDYEKLKTSEKELMAASTSRSSQAIRIALGMII